MIEIVCACCDKLGRHGGRGLRHSCYMRHHHAGNLDKYPPRGRSYPRQWRVESYAELRARRVPIREAADRLGVTDRTGYRYERQLKALEVTA